MANSIFAIILTITTFVTGTIWCINKYQCFSKNYIKKNQYSNTRNINHRLFNKYLKWIIEISISFFPMLFIVFIVRSFIFEPFQIPSGSMMPTLLIGDFILVKKYAYAIKDPIMHTTLISTSDPKRGDIAVFRYPKNPKLNYIKRIVGLPGDRIIYNPLTKKISIHPTCKVYTACDKSIPVTYSELQPSDFIQTFINVATNKVDNGFYQVPKGVSIQGGLRLGIRKEIFDNVEHNILLITQAETQPELYYKQPDQPQSSWRVPKDMYFMMGDNRDNSADSRFWGFVPKKNLIGKATAIWMSFDKQEGKWPTGIRLNRIGFIY